MKSPLALVKERFGDKAKLVEAVQQFTNDDLWVNRVNQAKGLAHVSNAKLLRLHATFSAVKEQFGTRAKLIETIAEIAKRSKDDGYKARLSGYPVPRLFDLYRSLSKGSKSGKQGSAVAAKAEAKPAAKKTAAKAAKAPAAKKTTTAKKKTAK